MLKFNERLRNIFGTHGEPVPQKLLPPLFITGCMRSGTTILVDELSSHPQLLKIGVELNKVWTEIGGAPMLETCPCSENLETSSIHTFNMTNYIHQFINESKGFKRHLMRTSSKIENNLGRVFYDWDNLVPMNKSPHLINKIEYVKALFPQSKFIYIIRDIYNQSASLKIHLEKLYHQKNEINYFDENSNDCWERVVVNQRKATWSDKNIFPESFKPIPLSWLKLNYYGLKSLKKLPKEDFVILNYDDLLSNKSEFYEHIFAFLNLKQSHQKAVEKIKNTNTKIINTTTKGTLNKKWKTILTEEEKKVIDLTIQENKATYQFIENERKIASEQIQS